LCRRHLDERRVIARRLYTREAEVEELKTKLRQPGGYRLVGHTNETRTVEAAQKVQSLWRRMQAKKQHLKRVGERDREAAAQKLQAATRRRQRQRRPGLLAISKQDDPANRPIDAARMLKHEEEILKKRREYRIDMTGGKEAQEELRRRAMTKYREFVEGLERNQKDVRQTLLQKEQTRQMIRALEVREGTNAWDHPLPYGVCSAALMREAEEKHRERKANIARDLWVGGPTDRGAASSGAPAASPRSVDDFLAAEVPLAVESRAEEAEADEMLRGLEADLGYDFSEKVLDRPRGADPFQSTFMQPARTQLSGRPGLFTLGQGSASLYSALTQR